MPATIDLSEVLRGVTKAPQIFDIYEW